MAIFKSEVVQMTHGINLAYSPVSGNNIIEVAFNNPVVIKNKFGLQDTKGCANGLLDELRCKASISSIPEVALPEYVAGEEESLRINKAASYEWGSARFELEVYTKARNSTEWIECGTVALKNAGGFRYRIHRLLDLVTDNIGARLAEYERLGIAVRNVGYGFAQAFDRITIRGTWVQEYQWASEIPPAVVVNNYNYGASSGGSTPTPATPPSFTLALASGSTTAVANNNDSISLTITNVANGTQLTGTWYKGTTELPVTESITVTGSVISLLTNKLISYGTGNYKLKFTVSGTVYETNAVSVTVNPSVVVSITSGAEFVENANSNPIGIVGSRFTAGTANYVWLLNNNLTTLTGSFTVDSNGSFSVSNQTSAQFNNYGNSTGGNPTGGRGYWRLKVTQGGVDYLSNQIYAIDSMPAFTVSPTTASIGGNVTITVSTTKFFAGDVISYSWQKDNVDIANTASDKTWSQNSGNAFAGYSYAWTVTSSQFASTPYLGAGTYRIKLRFQGLTIYSNAITISA